MDIRVLIESLKIGGKASVISDMELFIVLCSKLAPEYKDTITRLHALVTTNGFRDDHLLFEKSLTGVKQPLVPIKTEEQQLLADIAATSGLDSGLRDVLLRLATRLDKVASPSAYGDDEYAMLEPITLSYVTAQLMKHFTQVLLKDGKIKQAADPASIAVYFNTGVWAVSKIKSGSKSSESKDDRPPRACYNCGEEGHRARFCKKPATCFSCHKEGHRSDACPDKSGSTVTGSSTSSGDKGSSSSTTSATTTASSTNQVSKLPPSAGRKTNFHLGSVKFAFTAASISSSKLPWDKVLDDTGSRVHTRYNREGLVGIHEINATAIGIGSTAISAVGSWIGECLTVSGEWVPIRLRQVFVCEALDRHIYASALARKLEGVYFERNACGTGRMIVNQNEDDEISYALSEHPELDDAYLWFTMRPLPLHAWTEDDKSWLHGAYESNRLTVAAPASYAATNGNVSGTSLLPEEMVASFSDSEECDDDA